MCASVVFVAGVLDYCRVLGCVGAGIFVGRVVVVGGVCVMVVSFGARILFLRAFVG